MKTMSLAFLLLWAVHTGNAQYARLLAARIIAGDELLPAEHTTQQ